MTTSNNGSNCGSNYGNDCSTTSTTSKGTSNWSPVPGKTGNTGSTGYTSTTPNASTATATCAEITCGSTYSVNEIPSPGCYVCHWNGSLLRVSDAAFTTGGFTSFNFTSSDPLTVTYLTDDPTATIEECRNWAVGTSVYCNF